MPTLSDEHAYALSLLEIERGEDGNPLSFSVNISEEFVEWFKKDQKLKRWSDNRFQKWFKGFLTEAIREVVVESPSNNSERFTNPFDLVGDL